MPSTSILRTVRRATAALLLAGTVGAAALASGSGTAMALEPAKLSTSLAPSSRSTAAAIYVNSQTPATVVFYSPSFMTSASGPAAGTPCSSASLAIDAVTTHVIQVYVSGGYSYRRCL